MPIREVAKYQQTFHGTTEDNEFTFSFYRVYKHNQKNRFRIRVIQIADHRASSVTTLPHAYFAQDFSNGTSTYSDETSQGGTGMKSNEFCLGVVAPIYFGGTAQTTTSGLTQFLAPEVILDEISTSPFTVTYRHIGSDAYATGDVGLLFTLDITEIEEMY